nr:MBL fold metallo-hydrolase [Candidatus Freyrarchaeum guaymaensis]
MPKPLKVLNGVFLVGDAYLSHPTDCCVYLVDAGSTLVLVDAGTGLGFRKIVQNIKSLGYNPEEIGFLIATHKHIDHVGGCHAFKEKFKCKIIMHELDAEALESGDQFTTGAELYGVKLQPCTVDVKISETSLTRFGNLDFHLIHSPGHTPGSISVLVEVEGKRVLFGQDIHGPIEPSWGADVNQYCSSMRHLLSLNADVLCEGHYGIYRPAEKVKEYIERYMEAYGCL